MRAFLRLILGFGIVALSGTIAMSQDVRILPDVPAFEFSKNGATLRIDRIQDQTNTLTGEFALTSRACPPFCIQPATAAPGVETVAELELMAFLGGPVSDGSGVLVDARLPEFFVQGTIPGAVNMPFAALAPDNIFLPDILGALGARNTGGSWDFTSAFDLLVFGNGPWSDMAQRAVLNLIAAGYPVNKIRYYRAGLQGWQSLGLSIAQPAQ